MAKPETVVRIGPISATIWRQKADGHRPFHTVKLQRSYRDGDERKYSDSFTLSDLANVQRVLAKAQEYVEERDIATANDE